MPNAPPSSPTMDIYARKTKPRTIPTSQPPLHIVTPAPRALVPPATASRLSADAPPSDEISPRAPRGGEHHDINPRSPATMTPQKPRKRFRKKVNGLFGDQTDLKKRMSKLLRETDTNALLRVGDSEQSAQLSQQQPEPQPVSATNLPSTDVVVQKLIKAAMGDKTDTPTDSLQDSIAKASHTFLTETSVGPDFGLDSFDSPEFVATASRALGSPARLRTVRQSMGRLSPRSNERFIEELQLGPTSKLSREEYTEDIIMEGVVEKIEPPELPSVDSSELDTEEREALLAMSPVSVERTAAPAVLRRKVRRLDRGYRSADVLRARLQGTPLAEIAMSPTSRRRGDKSHKWRSRVRKLDLSQEDGVIRGRHAKRQRSEHIPEESQEVESDGMSSDGAPPKKRKLRADSERYTQNETEDTYTASDPLAMLVDAAAAEEQKQRSVRNRSRGLHISRRGEHSEGRERRPSKERRRKKKGNSDS